MKSSNAANMLRKERVFYPQVFCVTAKVEKESESSPPNQRRVLLGIFILALVLGGSGAYYAVETIQKSNPKPVDLCKVGTSIGRGDFTLPIVDRSGITNQMLTLREFKCNVIVLEFMAPWCPPCQNVVPAMESLYKQYANKGVVFIAVSVPWKPNLTDYENVTITQFLNTYNSSLIYVYDSTGSVTSTWNIQQVPTLFVLDKNGSVNATYTGQDPVSSGSVAQTIDSVLG